MNTLTIAIIFWLLGLCVGGFYMYCFGYGRALRKCFKDLTKITEYLLSNELDTTTNQPDHK